MSKVTTEQFQTEFDDRVQRAAERALRSLDRLASEVQDARENVVAWAAGEKGLRPDIHHQRVGDAVTDTEAFAQVAGFAAEHRNFRMPEDEDDEDEGRSLPVSEPRHPAENYRVDERDGSEEPPEGAQIANPGEKRIEREMLDAAGAEIGDRIRLIATTPPGMIPEDDALVGKYATLTGSDVSFSDPGDPENGPRVEVEANLTAKLDNGSGEEDELYLQPGDFVRAPFRPGDVVRHAGSVDDVDQRAVVFHVRDDGRVDLIAPGAEGVGLEVIEGAFPDDLIASDRAPKAVVAARADELVAEPRNPADRWGVAG